MPLRLRRVRWPEDHGPCDRFDYNVFDNDTVVGRICLKDLSGDARGVWSIDAMAMKGDRAPGGQEATLHDAMNAVAVALGGMGMMVTNG
jgi:hypothetical protein